MKVLITGGLGFIGSNLVRHYVKNGDNVTILDGGKKFGANNFNISDIKNNLEVIKGDISNYKLVLKTVQNKDLIFCVAGQVSSVISLQDPFADLRTNTIGNLNILESCKLKNPNASIVFTSSRSVYGYPHYLPIDENHPTYPFDGYGITKLAAEGYFSLYNQLYGLKTCILRLANAFGPRQQLHTGNYQIIAWIYSCIVQEKTLTIYGNGEQARDFIFIDDVCNALKLAGAKIKKSKGKIFNVGSGTAISLNSLIEKISKITSKKPKIKYSKHPKERKITEVPKIKLNCNKIKNELKWSKKTKLEDGLQLMHEFYSKPKILKKYTNF